MRIRKLISRKKISAPNPSSNDISSSVSTIPSSCPAADAATTSTVLTSTTGLKDKEAEPLNILQKQHVGTCELNMSVWDLTPDDEFLYYRKDEEVSKVIKNEDKKQKHYDDDDDDDADDDDHKITDESVNTVEYKIRTEGDDDRKSAEDDEETEELKEEQYAMEKKGKLGLKSMMNENDDNRKRDYDHGDIESIECDQEIQVYHEETEDEHKNNKRKRQSDYDYDTDYEEEEEEKKCSMKNGKEWHCQSKAQTGNPLCKHHLIQKQQRIFRKLNKITARRGRPGLKSVAKNDDDDDDDKKRKRDYEEDIEETEVDNEWKLGLKSEEKKNKRKLESDSDYDIDDYKEEEKNKVVYGCKTDGKKWHCRSKAQTGNQLCEHHTIQMQRHSDYHYHQRKLANKRIGKPPKESRTSTVDTTTNRVKRNKSKRGRPSNKGKLSGKKSSEFYYYSGFGPLWGKSKRGRPSNEVKKQPEDSEVKLEEERKVITDHEALITRGVSPVKFNEENVNDTDNGCVMFVDDEFDDDYNTDEDCNGVYGKIKNRKSIKARSLNSLF